MNAAAVRHALRRLADSEKAAILRRFFKTGKGEYGEGDVFLGVVVPKQRIVARSFRKLSLSETTKLLKSRVHEERLTALLIFVDQFARDDETARRRIFDCYLRHTRWINNWDLVDLTAPQIVGGWLYSGGRGDPRSRGDKSSAAVLSRLAKSTNLWERRIAMLATYHWIRRGDPRKTLNIAGLLVGDEHDLIHKAVGWMLREVGQKCSWSAEEAFLKRHAPHMPRTMLRYAIEKFPKPKQKAYLAMKAG